jgi:DNA-binding NarL/FixJ family response regulator
LACVAAARVVHPKGELLGRVQVLLGVAKKDMRIMSDAIVLIDDLFFQAKLHETAKLTEVTLETVTTGEQLVKSAAANPSALIIVDLNARQGAVEAIEQLGKSGEQGNPRRVIAFLSHVQTNLAERARMAGCREVMPRSKFTQNLAAILRGAKS